MLLILLEGSWVHLCHKIAEALLLLQEILLHRKKFIDQRQFSVFLNCP